MFELGHVYRNRKMKTCDFYVCSVVEKPNEPFELSGFWITRADEAKPLGFDHIKIKREQLVDWELVGICIIEDDDYEQQKKKPELKGVPRGEIIH